MAAMRLGLRTRDWAACAGLFALGALTTLPFFAHADGGSYSCSDSYESVTLQVTSVIVDGKPSTDDPLLGNRAPYRLRAGASEAEIRADLPTTDARDTISLVLERQE
jgi:hypothetical protein